MKGEPPTDADSRGVPGLSPGTVTQLVTQKKNTERVSVFIDGTFAFGLYREVAVEHGLRKGRRLSVADQQGLLEADGIMDARARAFHYLAFKQRTEEEVRRRLARHGFGEHVIEDVLHRLRELGYVDDEAYARAYADGRFASGGYGPARVRSELMRRGVDRKTIDVVLAEVYDEDEEVIAVARREAQKRWRRLQSEPDPLKRRKKLGDFLSRRGFSYDVVRAVTDELDGA